jgi:hypothetical protein
MCSDEIPANDADANPQHTDPASAPGVRIYSDYLRKLKPSIALAAGRKAAAAYNRKWYQRNKNKALAQRMTRLAIDRGELVRPATCEQCGGNTCGIEAHHCDYDKPLDVMWLCRWCHKKWHRDNGKGING